jgi:cytochrome c556
MRGPTKVAVTLTGLMALGVVSAAEDPVAERRRIMEKNERVEAAVSQLILGKFLVKKVGVAMQTLEENMTVFATLFPQGSDKGETRASPAIWTNMEDFRALAAKTVEDAKAAEAAAAEGQDVFAGAWQAVARDCNLCHAKYAPTMN